MKMMKSGLIFILAVALIVLSGCSTSKPPREAIVSALTKMQDIKSMTYTGTFAIDDISLPESLSADPSAAMVGGIVGMMKGASVKLHGAMKSDPQQAEFTMDVSLGSADMKFNLSIPIIATAEKVWVKIPEIPGASIPDSVAGKFVEIDLKKLAEEQGTASIPDTASMQKLGQDMLKTMLDNFDEKTYFSEPKASEIQDLPEGYKAEQFVRFTINQGNFETALTTIINDVAPQIIDLLLNNEEYMNALQLKKEDLEKAKQEMAGTEDGEIQKAIDEAKKSLKVNEFSVTGGIQKDYLTFQNVLMNMDFIDGADTTKLAAHFTMAYADINKDVKFEYEIPKDAIPMDQLMQSLGAGAGMDLGAATGGDM